MKVKSKAAVRVREGMVLSGKWTKKERKSRVGRGCRRLMRMGESGGEWEGGRV